MPLPMGAPPLGSRLPPATLGMMQGAATPQRSGESAGTSASGVNGSFAPPTLLPPRPRSVNTARRQTYNRQGLDLNAVSANVHKARSAGVEPAGAGLVNASLWTGLFVYDKKTEGLMQLGLADADGQALDRYIDLTLQAQSLAQQPMPASDEEAAKIQEQLGRLERDIEREVSLVASRVEDQTIHAGRNLNAVGVAGHFLVDAVEGAGDITDQTVIGPLIAGAQVLAQAIKRQYVVDDRKQRAEQVQAMTEELRDIQSRIDGTPAAMAQEVLSVSEMSNALRV